MADYSIYFSPTGGTKKAADILSEHLFREYQEIDLCGEIGEYTFGAEDQCVISIPSYGGRVPAAAIEKLRKISANGAKAVLNCVYGNRAWEDTLTELQDVLEEQGFVCIAGVAAVAEHSIFRQFGAGRPDAEDAAELTGFAEKILERLKEKEYGRLELAGNHGTYKVYNGVLFKPEADESCTGCGVCAEKCPVGAIRAEDPKKTDKEICISCMRCVSVCPKKARGCDPELMKMMAEKMAPVLGGRKENALFL